MAKSKPVILVIVGPTASGKSDLAVTLAKKLNGEVVSADSRQVYTGLDIGTGKITTKEMRGVPHHLLDIADPKRTFTVVRYVKLADTAIQNILKRGKLPIVCGGTGFYIQALVDHIAFPEVPANKKLRKKLDSKTIPQLLAQLKKLDPKRFKQISENESDRQNKRRIIRAIEVAKTRPADYELTEVESPYSPIFIGLNPPRDELRAKIRARLLKRLKAGMLDEARSLHRNGLSWKRMEDLGLEYRYMTRFLQGKISKEEMVEKLSIEIGKYAKRQMTWFGRDKRIKWLDAKEKAAILTSPPEEPILRIHRDGDSSMLRG